MRERIRPTRSGLFAIELVAAVGVFTLCAAVCMGIFVQSEVMSQDSAALTRAVNEARSAAECFRASGGDLDRAASLFGGGILSDGAPVSLVQDYNANWNRIPGDGTALSPAEDGVFYQLQLIPGVPLPSGEAIPGCTAAELRVTRSDGQCILSWEIAALESTAPETPALETTSLETSAPETTPQETAAWGTTALGTAAWEIPSLETAEEETAPREPTAPDITAGEAVP